MKDENESTKTIEKNIDTGKEDINKKRDQKYNQVTTLKKPLGYKSRNTIYNKKKAPSFQN